MKRELLTAAATYVGVVSSVKCDRGFGFIATPGQPDVFFHATALVGLDFDEQLYQRRVRYEITTCPRGRAKAINVRPHTNEEIMPATVVEIFDTPGAGVWTCPAGVTSLDYVVCIGGGGAGCSGAGEGFENGGGGGGGSAIKANFAVTAGNGYAYIVGAGGVGAEGDIGTNGAKTTWIQETAPGFYVAGGAAGEYGGGGAGGSLRTAGVSGFNGGDGDIGLDEAGGGSGGAAGINGHGGDASGVDAGDAGNGAGAIGAILTAAGQDGQGEGGSGRDGAPDGENGLPGFEPGRWRQRRRSWRRRARRRRRGRSTHSHLPARHDARGLPAAVELWRPAHRHWDRSLAFTEKQ